MGFDIDISISAAAVFIQGLLSFFSPCVLPLLPLYAAYLSGGTLAGGASAAGAGDSVRAGDGDHAGNGTREKYDTGRRRGRLMVNTVFFVLGICGAFFLLGLGMNAVSGFFSARRRLFSGLGGAVIILLGLYQLGIFGESEVLSRERRLPFDVSRIAMSPLTALILGFLFSFSWTPCVGPMLSSVLILAAGSSSRAAGLALIGVYSLGFCLPFLAVGLFSDRLLDWFRKNRGFVKHSAKIGGAIMLAVGVLMLSGGLDRISSGLSAASGGESAYGQEAQGGASGQQGTSGNDAAGSSYAGNNAVGSNSAGEDAANKDVNFAPGYELRFTDQYGEEHSLSDYAGKMIFLNFWATWCQPCRAEMPYIQAVYEEYEGKDDADVVFIGVAFPGQSGEGSAEYITGFLEKAGYTYPVLMDPQAELAELYNITAFPTTFMLNDKGELYGYITGSLDKTMIEKIIDQTRNAGKPADE